MKRTVLLLTILSFLLAGWQACCVRRDLFHSDQSIFIDLAHDFSESPIWLKLLPPVQIAVTAKTLTHPLAAYCFSFFTGDFEGFYPRCKIVNVLFGLLTILALYKVTRVHCGETAGLVAALALGTNHFFLYNCSQFSSEPLLLLFFVLWLHFSVKCFHASGTEKASWFLAGASAGMAYLAKPNGIVLPIVFVLAYLFRRKRPSSYKAFALFSFSFLVFCSPLMYSQYMEGNFPLYNDNFNTVFAMTVDGYDDSRDLPNIVERGLLSNLGRFMRYEHIKKYVFHVPVFFKRYVNRLFNRYLPGPIPGIIWIVLFIALFVEFQRDGDMANGMAPLVIVFFVLYSLALVPVTIDNDSARFYLPLQIVTYIAFAHFVAKQGESNVVKALIVLVLAFLVLTIGGIALKRTVCNPLKATDTSIELAVDWIKKQPKGQTILYTFYEKWWLERILTESGRTMMGKEFIEVSREQLLEAMNKNPNSIIVLSSRSFSLMLNDVQGKRMFENDFVPQEFTFDKMIFAQVQPRTGSKVTFYKLLKQTKAKPSVVPTTN